MATSPTGVFIKVRSRSKSSHAGNDANGKAVDYAGTGIAIETLIDSTVSVTTRHSESAPIASVAAMALVSREEATGAGRPTKPTAPGDRIMVKILHDAGESPANIREFRRVRRQYCGNSCAENPEPPQALTGAPWLLTFGAVLAQK
jgi:hypothetical protein